MNKKYAIPTWFVLLTCFSLQPVLAAGEVEYTLEKTVTSITPVFMNGHPGELNWIEGFVFEGNIFIKGDNTPLGTYTGEATLLNPPMRTAEVYDGAFVKIENNLPGIGTFQTTGSSIGLGSSSNETTIAWSASISNGTGALFNNFGLSAGNGILNIFTGQGKITEVLNIRAGF